MNFHRREQRERRTGGDAVLNDGALTGGSVSPKKIYPSQLGHFSSHLRSLCLLLFSFPVPPLSQKVVYHLAMHVGQPTVGAIVTVGQLLVIDAEEVQHSGVKVVGAGRFTGGLP